MRIERQLNLENIRQGDAAVSDLHAIENTTLKLEGANSRNALPQRENLQGQDPSWHHSPSTRSSRWNLPIQDCAKCRLDNYKMIFRFSSVRTSLISSINAHTSRTEVLTHQF
jgi:hypothetical protein